ncbi:hypothetical protein Ahy_A07g034754 [Arachis hypogaea]|uniref:Uncharacterized protein n=1 Tax=Arachis hypogaea TaxID=3818 RepID=A0A445CCP0_ARAHY|nr:hypothetical protein Ahy_A07g034754 [Arachis hypogaea]
MLVNFVYPDLMANLTNSTYIKECTILAPTLKVVNNVNNHTMDFLIGDKKIYFSSDSLCIEDGNMEYELDTFTPDVLNCINCSRLHPYKLTLKQGVLVMLLSQMHDYR